MSKFKIVFIALIILFAGFMLLCPEEAKNGAVSGLLICSNVVIPTLYPFTFCVLFITNAINVKNNSFLNKITLFLFGLRIDEFLIFLLSLIGGFPTGAKLLEKHFSETDAYKKPNLMLCYCVNAGPAFIVMAVGAGILNSKALGWLLLWAHISSSIIIALLLKPFLIKCKTPPAAFKDAPPLSENLVGSAADSASAVFSVCIFVVLFAVFNSFLEALSVHLPFLRYISPLLEVTSAVSESRNIYHIAFLLGVSGVCVWFQIASLIKSFKLYLPLFIIARVSHGIISIFIMLLLLKTFKIHLPTFSTSVVLSGGVYKDISVAISLFIMGVLFIISTMNKNAGKNQKFVI